MKKVFITSTLISLFLMIGLTGCSSASDMSIDNFKWELNTVQSTDDNGAVIAYNPNNGLMEATAYPEAKPVDMYLTAGDGRFVLTNGADGETYEGTYKMISDKDKSAIYEITLGENIGYASVAMTSYHNGSQVPTLNISINDYALNFQAPYGE